MNPHETIYQNLSRRIADDEFSVGTMLPGLRVLAEQYNQTTIAVRQAVDLLKMEGIIHSHHGKGNFVQKKPVNMKDVMLISFLEGDLFSDILSEFTNIFNAQSGYQLILEKLPSPINWTNNEKGLQEFQNLELKLEESIANGRLDAIFFNDSDVNLIKLLSSLMDKTNIYCFFDPTSLPDIKCSAVTTDYYHGGSIGIRHLHDAGCRKLLVITHPTDPYSPKHVVNSFLNGCRKTAEELGHPLIEMRHRAESSDYVERFLSIMSEHPDIDGIYACADYRLSPIYSALNRLGRKIGEDCAVMGYYDTPWTKAFDPQLSSVNLKPREIVSEICNIYSHRGETGISRKSILPEIVARASSRLEVKK